MAELPLPVKPLVDVDIALRPWRDSDGAALAAFGQDEAIVKWTGVPRNYRAEEARNRAAYCEAERRDGRGIYFAVVETDTDELLGACDLRISPVDPAVGEVGFLLSRMARGRGVMTRAVRLLARWGFEELSLIRIEILTHPDNQASARVAVRAGFARQGLLHAYREKDGERQDRVVYSLIAPDSRK
jgi:RimJ/RimL family protein N-acetyltransferase